MIEDHARCYAALRARDPRFDGWFFVGVTSTGIYCRPSCPAMTPKREHVRFHATAASAQSAGFRACKRCRPDATPGSPAWDLRADLVGRAMRLIADGVVDREGVLGLASRLGYSSRHLHRQLVAEVGAGPLALARAQRAHAARVLIETTDLAFTQVAFAAGFASVRQFNDSVREVFAATPTALRARASRGVGHAADTVVVRLPYRRPATLAPVVEHLAVRAIPSVEQVTSGGSYRRSVSLPHAEGVVELLPCDGYVRTTLRLQDLRDLATAVQRCRRLFDLDADPVAVDGHLGDDPALARFVTDVPGLRVPRSFDPQEAALRVVLGQQVSVAGATTFAARLVERCGQVAALPHGEVTCRFPDAATVAQADLSGLGLTRQRTATLQTLAASLADGAVTLDVGADRQEIRGALSRFRGIGSWTVEEIALRGLGDPDAFPVTDLALRRSLRRLGLADDPAGLDAATSSWRPWRAYAAQHLWLHDTAGLRPAA